MALDIISNKEKFITILRNEVHREGIEEFISWLESTDFFQAPFTGQYTLACAGGLAQHSLNTYRALTELVDKYRQRDPNFLLDLPENYTEADRAAALAELDESIAICGLLHRVNRADCWVQDTRNVKNQTTGRWEAVPYYKWDEKFIYGSGEKSVYILQQFIKLYIEEAQAIRYHDMGRNMTDTIDNSFQKLYQVSQFASILGVAVQEATYILDPMYWAEG